MKKNPFICLNDFGLYCREGDFYIDPWRGVDKALITHAHSDHARPGSKNYLAVKESELLLRLRLGNNIKLQTINYGEVIYFNNVKVTFLPAGHVLGSSQIRIEHKGEVWVVSGDYKTEADFTCSNFEPIKCTHFITESTFGLPIFKWCSQQEIFNDINTWWKRNSENKITSVIWGYSIGKAQRVISGLESSIGPIYTHSSIENVNDAYRKTGIKLPMTKCIGEVSDPVLFNSAIIIAPPSSDTYSMMENFKYHSSAFASGWMQVRANRRKGQTDRGFILSDHADWTGLIETVKAVEAEKIYVTHGYSSSFAKFLCESGFDAEELKSQFVIDGDGD